MRVPCSLALLTAASFLTPGLLAATLTVNTTEDSGPGSLRDAIGAASAGDGIVFDPSLARVPIHLTSGEIVIDKDLTITGLGRDLTIVSGPVRIDPYDYPEHRLFVIRPGVVARLAGMSLVNGSTLQTPGGAAILNDGELTLVDCELSGNFSADGDGGALYNKGSLEVFHTAFLGNRIEDHGSGSGLYNAVSGHVRLSRSSFSDNASPYGGGSAIGNAGWIEAEDCEFIRNSTVRGAGAIVNRPGAAFYLKRSIVRDNYALYNGGGAVNVGLLSISESTFVNNTVGARVGFGGGITNDGTLVLTNSTLQSNGISDVGGHGGGIYNSGFGRVVLTNTTVTGNYVGSTEYGGAAGLENAGTAVIRGSLIAGNYSLSTCYAYPPPPEVALRGDLKGLVESLGRNFVGGCTGLDPSTCSESIACGGFEAGDLLDVDVEQLVESEPVRLWPWAGGSPRCGLLASNGGPTPTVAPLPGSPIIDSIPTDECTDDDGDRLITDQRGTLRPQGAGCDVGSFELSVPRGTGFWGHQCSGLGYLQLTPAEMQALFDQVAEASAAFPECAPIGCDTLRLETPRNDTREKAERSLLGLWLNLITGHMTRGRPIDLPGLTTAATAGEALAEVEAVVCDSNASRGDLGTVKQIAEAINNQGEDMELVSPESSATVPPGAVRSFTLAVVNMGPDIRSYDLTSAATWPVALSRTRINAVGPDQIALVTATVSVPLGSSGQSGEIRVTATDRNSDAALARTAAIRILVSGTAGPAGDRKIRRLE